MNTNTLKSFAKNARITLCEGVYNQLFFWGFTEDGTTETEPVKVGGGFSFRGKIYDSVSAFNKWEKLNDRIDGAQQHFQDVAEEAAYTWFNRLVAIKVLEENKFIDPVVGFEEGTQIPKILQDAKSGNHNVTHSGQKELLKEALLNNKDEEAFAILLLNYCHKHPLLEAVFGKPDDYTEILIPQNLLSGDGFLAQLNDKEIIPTASFQEVELIGWLYQFYISDKKNEVFKGFKKRKKARAEDIPAATQIFTPRWIVEYMVQNTIGKLYLNFDETSELEEEMKYLVTSEEDSTVTERSRSERSRSEREATEPLIEDLEELTLIDPASGSGHILVVGLEWLYKMYREQGYPAKMAIENIVKHNLYGLDIDDRAMQLGRFAVLLKAAQLLEENRTGEGKAFINQVDPLIPQNYAFPEERSFVSEDIGLLTDDQHVKEIYDAFKELRQGKNIGAALQIELSQEARQVLQETYTNYSAKEDQLNLEEQAVWETLKAYMEVALTLTQKYTGVVANPPYMGQKNMNADLKKYVKKHYKNTKSDLCTVFIEVFPGLTNQNGKYGFIVPPSWLFLSTYKKLREKLISSQTIDSLLHLSRGVFGADFGSVCTVLSNTNPSENSKGNYYRLVRRTFQEFYYGHLEELFLKAKNDKNFKFRFADYSKSIDEIKHSDEGQKIYYPSVPQSNFAKIPGSPIAYWISEKIVEIFKDNKSFIEYGKGVKGLDTGKDALYLRNWWEPSIQNTSLKNNNVKWFPYHKGGKFRKWYGNKDYLVNWENSGKELNNFKRAYPRNKKLYFKDGIEWSRISSSAIGLRKMEESIFGGASQAAFVKRPYQFNYLLGLLNTNITNNLLKMLNPTLIYQAGNINSIPIVWEKAFKNELDLLVEKNISFSKKDWDSRETSWDFKENPLIQQKAHSLEGAYQNWKKEVSQDFFQLHENEEELNRIFIDIYGLQDELSPEVALKDITILQDEIKNKDLEALEEEFRAEGEIELPIQEEVVVQQFLSYLIGVILGRYRLDQPGVHIAHPEPTAEETAAYQVEEVAEPFTFEMVQDAILPMMGSACNFRNDVLSQIQELVYHIWGADTQNENLNFINNALGMDLEKWLTDKFWKQYHTKGNVYGKTPIYWLFSSNQSSPHRAAFQVLVYMHRMDAFTVQKIRQNYLHPHQKHVRRQIEDLESHEADLTKEEQKQLDTLRKQVSELRDYDETLKEMANAQITFDLDDGVKENYKLFKGAVVKM